MKTNRFFLVAMATLLAACSGSSDSEEPVVPPTPEPTRVPLNLSVGLQQTRATDNSFETGDRVGLYVVNYEGTQAGTLAVSGNHADNHLFTYNGSWQTANQLYWKDETTHADFYVYYPYQTSVSSVTAFPFSVQADQSTTSAYKASELLWGKTTDVAPTSSPVSIMTKHLMSSAVVKLVAGEGFTDASLAAANPVVTINGVRNASTVNMATGEVTPTGTVGSVKPYKQDTEWRAFIVPQTASATDFITVSIEGRDYRMNKEFTFVGGTRHTFTVTVRKTSNGINVGITAWDEDQEDNGGVAE